MKEEPIIFKEVKKIMKLRKTTKKRVKGKVIILKGKTNQQRIKKQKGK